MSKRRSVNIYFTNYIIILMRKHAENRMFQFLDVCILLSWVLYDSILNHANTIEVEDPGTLPLTLTLPRVFLILDTFRYRRHLFVTFLT